MEHPNETELQLSVYPPDGRVRIAAPLRMNLDTIRVYAIFKLARIKQQQQKPAIRNAKTSANVSTARVIMCLASATCSP
jgi:hypothetical protein